MKKLGNVSILIRGDDAEIPDEINYIKSIGGKFMKIPYTKGISSTYIINKINHKN
jgi:bifunctional ADP-heptose synthase (sugar kinase/adenylyltransferase)